jgi:hypothetical protein
MSEDRLQVVTEDGDANERFAQLSTVLAKLESGSDETALVPVASVAPMISAIAEVLGYGGGVDSRDASLETTRQAIRAEARDEARHRFRLSRVGSGSIAVALSGLWLIPQVASAWGGEGVAAVIQASLVAPLFAYPLFDPLVFGFGLYAWLFFALTWFMEQTDLRRIDWVTTDEARGILLKRAVLAARQRGDQDSIRKSDMRDALGRGLRPAFALRLLGGRDVTASFLDRVTGHHLAELTAQGVLAPSTEASLSPRYLLAGDVSRDLKPWSRRDG